MLDSVKTFLESYLKEIVLSAIAVWFAVSNREYFSSLFKQWKTSLTVDPSEPLSDQSINEALLSGNPRQQSFYYLERLRDYAAGLNASEALKTLDTLQANLFNIPSQKP